MVQATTATRPTKRGAGRRARVEQEPYIDARQHVRNIAVLVSFEEMQNYVAKHDLYQPGRGDRFTKEEAEQIEGALDEKAEELRAAGETKSNGHDTTVTAADTEECPLEGDERVAWLEGYVTGVENRPAASLDTPEQSAAPVVEAAAEAAADEELGRMQPRRFTKELPVVITSARRVGLLEELRQQTKERAREAAKLESAKSHFKFEDRRIAAREQVINDSLDRGTEYLDVECEERFDYGAKVALTVRLDTGAELERRQMTTKELQPTLIRL